MRAIVFFDLPTLTTKDRKEMARFRKYLLKNGFIMMQKSVYIRLALNKSILNSIVNNLRNNKPSGGLVQLLVVTEKQFGEIEYIIGENTSDTLSTEDNLVVL